MSNDRPKHDSLSLGEVTISNMWELETAHELARMRL